jgi:hypothetical protein
MEGRVAIDRAIFADTGSEPAAVYAHLDRLRELSSIPIDIVAAGNLGAKVLAGGFADIPLRQINADGSSGLGRRQCTYQFKMRPIRRRIHELTKDRADLLMGISLDEVQRMRDSDVGYIRNEYPLVDLGWKRWDCQRYLAEKGVDAPRSACVFCPYRTNAEWRMLSADEFAAAVAVDESIRVQPKGRTAYLHTSLRPLAEVDLSTPEERGQLNWLEECEGMCGV